MASSNMTDRLEGCKRDLSTVINGPRIASLKRDVNTANAFDDATKLALRWLGRVEPFADRIEDGALIPLAVFAERIASIVDGNKLGPNETVSSALVIAGNQFRAAAPYLAGEWLEASGLLSVLKEDVSSTRISAINDVHTALSEAKEAIAQSSEECKTELRKTADSASQQLLDIKTEVNKISIDSAQQQFQTAAGNLRTKAIVWSVLTGVLFAGMIGMLVCFTYSPPPLIKKIVAAFLDPTSRQATSTVSVPLLIAASAYYTSLRLVLLGFVGVGFAFSLRMTRAYFQMIEHNQHKLRVTNSIEAFVASVNTKEQRDLVLGKLVDSVTAFGESGILGKETDSASLPTVVIDAITKNIGKSS
jgi:hypothetical protein